MFTHFVPLWGILISTLDLPQTFYRTPFYCLAFFPFTVFISSKTPRDPVFFLQCVVGLISFSPNGPVVEVIDAYPTAVNGVPE